MENFRIRRAKAGDIPALLRLLGQVNRLHHAGRPDLFRPGTKYGAGELEGLLADDARPVFVACDAADAVLGYVFCVLRQTPGDAVRAPAKTLYVDDLCVDERTRGQGVGRALYARARDLAKASGCHNLTLHVWACNKGARRFYETLGLAEQMACMEDLLQ